MTYERGRLVRDGLRVAILGRPNAGKSSLLNALLGEERAIVTPIAGTTRDVIEEAADFFGVPVVLSDTAGLRDSPDEIEKIGIARAHATAQEADVSLLVVDASLTPEPPIVPVDRRTIPVLNKIDLPSAWDGTALREAFGSTEPVRVSATQHLGLDDLRRRVLDQVVHAVPDGVPTLASERHREVLGKAHASLTAAVESAAGSLPLEIIAVDLQAALDHIGRVTGVIASDEILDAIFAEFCLGK
jgi:tRNA modification GTPase